MKKINQIKIKTVALTTFAMLANVAIAQNLKVTSGGVPVSDGDVIELKWEYEEESYPELGMSFYYYKWDPHMEVSTDSGSSPLTVTVTSIDNTDGFSICWPSVCLDVSPNGSKSASGTINEEPQDLQIHKGFDFDDPDKRPTEGGTILVTLHSGSETVEVTIKALLEGDTGVGENIADPNMKSTYYTLQGIRVAEPQKGQLYIEHKGGKSTKRLF